MTGEDPTFMQGILLGYVAMMLHQQTKMELDVTVPTDSDGYYLPEIHVRGRVSGLRWRVTVEPMP